MKKLQKSKAAKDGRLTPYLKISEKFTYLKDSSKILLEEGGELFLDEIIEGIKALVDSLEDLELKYLLSGPHDMSNALLTIHPGAGGTESQDWAQILMRMYLRWAEKKGFETEVLDLLQGEEAGIKSATIMFKGPYAYGYLKEERGVHRLVRISPFDSAKRRHTSFTAVLVYPEIEDEVEVEINDEDLRVDTFRASGAGGQHVNKTSSAIRLTHQPSGIVVSCQNERSQHRNKERAMKVLRARLYDLQLKEQEKKMEGITGDKKDIAWGSQIRSYVLQPYRMIKDHRTGVEIGNVDAVLDGGIDTFISASLKTRKSPEKKQKPTGKKGALQKP